MFAHWDDVEFTYKKIYYNFMRESDGSINIWRGHGYQKTVYTADTFDVEEIVNAKIFDDGKSVAQVQAEVEL